MHGGNKNKFTKSFFNHATTFLTEIFFPTSLVSLESSAYALGRHLKYKQEGEASNDLTFRAARWRFVLRDFATVEIIQLCMSCNLQLKFNSEVFAQVFFSEEQLEINCDVVCEEQDFIIRLKFSF